MDVGMCDGGDGSGLICWWGCWRCWGGWGMCVGGTRLNARREDDGNGMDDDGGRDV